MTAVITAASPAWGDDVAPPVEPARALPYAGDLDGDYLLLGPIGGAVAIEGAWDSAFGGGVAWLRLRERAWLGAGGVAFSGGKYAERPGGRFALEGIAGSRRLLGGRFLAGVTLGPAVELQPTEHARFGITASVWAFVGVTPYLRAGWLDEAGSYGEIGLAIALPIRRW